MDINDIQILLEAGVDLEDGRTFYNKQKQGIGEYFWDCLISDIESLLIYAGIHTIEHGYFRMVAKRFPYSIYYEVKGKKAYVVAVLPMRRKPSWIKEKLTKSN
jgi:hypothetical protein